jgi:hypothetical protein
MFLLASVSPIILFPRGPGQNRVTWKSPSRAAFVPLQDPVAVLAILRSPHANAGMKQYECGSVVVHNFYFVQVTIVG